MTVTPMNVPVLLVVAIAAEMAADAAFASSSVSVIMVAATTVEPAEMARVILSAKVEVVVAS